MPSDVPKEHLSRFFLGFVVVVWNQVQSRTVARDGIYAKASDWTFDLDKVFVQYPELRPYFYANKDIDEKDPVYPRALAVAEYTADTMDSVLAQKGFVQQYPGFNVWIDREMSEKARP